MLYSAENVDPPLSISSDLGNSSRSNDCFLLLVSSIHPTNIPIVINYNNHDGWFLVGHAIFCWYIPIWNPYFLMVAVLLGLSYVQIDQGPDCTSDIGSRADRRWDGGLYKWLWFSRTELMGSNLRIGISWDFTNKTRYDRHGIFTQQSRVEMGCWCDV